MKKKLQHQNESVEVVYRCADCGARRSVVQTQAEAGKAPAPCKHCRGTHWIQAS